MPHPAPGDAPVWPPAPETWTTITGATVTTPDSKPVRGLRRIPGPALFWGGLLVIGLIAGAVSSAGRSSSGDINKAGELAPSDLRVGDCFDIPEEVSDSAATQFGKATGTPCADPHKYEVFVAETMTGYATYPTHDQFDAWSLATCKSAFAPYVGVTFDNSTLDVWTFYPTDTAWAHGDHGAQCSLADPANSARVGSLKGSKR
jgi:hypothetical protein